MTQVNAFWNTRYKNTETYLFGEEPARGLVGMEGFLPERAEILCVADGEGRNSVWLARQGYRVTGFDPAPVAVSRAQDLATRHGVALETHVDGIETWDWARRFDVVAGIFIQFSPPDERQKVFAKMAGAIRPGGLILLHGFAPRQVNYGTGGPGDPAHLYTIEMLQEAFAGWEVLHARDYDGEQSSGSGHSGMAALVDFIARKPL
jgi:SAM-dependent methyltransferase